MEYSNVGMQSPMAHGDLRHCFVCERNGHMSINYLKHHPLNGLALVRPSNFLDASPRCSGCELGTFERYT